MQSTAQNKINEMTPSKISDTSTHEWQEKETDCPFKKQTLCPTLCENQNTEVLFHFFQSPRDIYDITKVCF